jgi:hypothetical protein
MIPTSYKEYYGDETRWFLGTVLDINDPEQLGRVKVRIYGVHPDNTNDASLDDLPWSHVSVPITEGGSSGIGSNTGIKPMAQVYGIFLDGKNSQIPLVLGSIPKIEAAETYQGNIQEARDDSKLRGATNLEKAFEYFVSEEGGSFTPEQACGILGNLHVENGVNLRNSKDLDPTIDATEKDGAKAFGIAQWNDAPRAANREGGLTRYAELLDFSAKNGLDYRTLYAQLSFIKYELFKYKALLGIDELKRAETPEQASEVFQREYERPQNTIETTEERKKEARKYFERFA